MRTLYTHETGTLKIKTIFNRHYSVLGKTVNYSYSCRRRITWRNRQMMELWETDPTPGHMWDYHTEITWARVVMNELTGTAQPPGDSSDVWRLRTHHMRQFKFIQLETAELRLLIYHIRRKLLRNMLNSILEKMKRAQAKFQMCRAHLSDCINITHGIDIRSHHRQTGTAGFSTF